MKIFIEVIWYIIIGFCLAVALKNSLKLIKWLKNFK
jgi:hypothetical protein